MSAQPQPDMEAPGPAGPRLPLQSFVSVSSVELRTLTTCNCELAVLPLAQLLDLQPRYLELRPDEQELESCHRDGGGYNLYSEGSFCMEGRQYRAINYISRKVDLNSHLDYKDYRETILSRPMLFITTAKKESAFKETTFAFIVNTRHPKVKAQIEGGMNRIISSVVGESYKLQFNFENVVKDFFAREDFVTQGDGLNFSYEFHADALLDFFYMLGLSKKTVHVNGRVMNLYSKNPEKKEVVKMFLSKMTDPYVRMNSTSDRRFSTFSASSFDDDAFRSQRPSIAESPEELPAENTNN